MSPKIAFLCSFLLVGAGVARADYSVTLSNIHLCCDSCVKDVGKTVGQVSGASADANKAAHTVTVTAPDHDTAQKAVDALVASGYYGTPSDSTIKVSTDSGSDQTVTGLKVGDVHLCCKKCVTTVNKAVAKVQGVTGTTASKDAESFEISGTFNAKDVIAALHAAGFSAKVE